VIDIRSPWPPRPPRRGRRDGDRIEIDTTVLIDALRGDPSAVAERLFEDLARPY